MMISGVLVVTRSEHLDGVRVAIDEHEWAQVHHVEPERGRMIATIDASTTDEATSRLLELRDLAHVILADMVEHYQENEPGS